MASKSRAIIVDAFSIGRLARGERWTFTEMTNRINVSSRGQPLFLDRMRLDPSSQTLAALGAMEGFGYLATVGLFADGVEAWERMVRSLQEELLKSPAIRGAASPLSRGGCVVR